METPLLFCFIVLAIALTDARNVGHSHGYQHNHDDSHVDSHHHDHGHHSHGHHHDGVHHHGDNHHHSNHDDSHHHGGSQDHSDHGDGYHHGDNQDHSNHGDSYHHEDSPDHSNHGDIYHQGDNQDHSNHGNNYHHGDSRHHSNHDSSHHHGDSQDHSNHGNSYHPGHPPIHHRHNHHFDIHIDHHEHKHHGHDTHKHDRTHEESVFSREKSADSGEDSDSSDSENERSGSNENTKEMKESARNSGEVSENGHGHDEAEKDEDEKLWLFQVGDDFSAYEYRDMNGYVTGFYIDLLDAVCRRAGKRCQWVFDDFRNCWSIDKDGNEYPGKGLMGGWYDGCLGMWASPDRMNSFNFTDPFTPDMKAALHYRNESMPLHPKDITGKRIGFVDGWAVSEKCLQRQLGYVGNNRGMYESTRYDSHEDMLTGLLLNKTDAIFSSDLLPAERIGLVPVTPWIQCTVGGLSVMTTYGSGVPEWWNPAFREMVTSGDFSTLCQQSSKKHGHRGRISCRL